MALDIKKLSGNVGAGSLAPALYTYNADTDTKANVIAADYFLALGGTLNVGDNILCVCADGTVQAQVATSTTTGVTVTTVFATI